MNKKYLALVLILICTLFTALGQIFWKVGVQDVVLGWQIIFNHSLWVGFILYGLGALLLIYSLRYGNLSFVHPFLSLGYVWASFFAFLYLKEDFPIMKILAIGLVILGTFFIFRGDKK